MYHTCLFCYSGLGSNEILPSFPVGRRLAFDPSKGRLWVVCRNCARWNLSPLEERWEAVEDAERCFKSSQVRVSTENIGLARMADGVDLIRIGSAKRAELTGWRYGSHLRRRRVKQYVYATALLTGAGAAVVTGAYSVLLALPGAGFLVQAPNWVAIAYGRFGVVARVETDNGEKVAVRGKHVQSARIEHDGVRHRLLVQHDGGRGFVEEPQSVTVASRLLARINANGASAKSLKDAVRHLDRTLTSTLAIDEIARTLPGTLASLPTHVRVAMEIAAQESNEQRAMEGELRELEEAWKEAEEIAAISDWLLVPAWVEERLRNVRVRIPPQAEKRDGA